MKNNQVAKRRKVYIGIGSNIDPERNMKTVAMLLRQKWPHIDFSAVYRCAPREEENQPIFLNAVAMIETSQAKEKIIRTLHAMEDALHKAPQYRFGPRTIDIDLLLSGSEVVPSKEKWKEAKERNDPTDQEMYVPHLRMDERRFALEPLLTLMEGNEKHPVLDISFRKLCEQTKQQACVRTEIVL